MRSILFLFLLFSVQISAQTFDEIYQPEFALADFPNDPSDVTEFGPPAPTAFCKGLLARLPSAKARIAGCPVRSVVSGTNMWLCQGDTYNPDAGICQTPSAGTTTFGVAQYHAVCGENYTLVNPSGSSAKTTYRPFGDPGPTYTFDRSHSGATCERCMAPYTWDEDSKSCKVECAYDEQFNTRLGMCVEKSDRVEIEHCSETDGNPVYAKTGEKRQIESPDYTGGGLFPIVFARSYYSYRAPNAPKISSMKKGATQVRTYTQPPNYLSTRQDFGWNLPTIENKTNSGEYQWRHSYSASIVDLSSNQTSVMVINALGEKRHFTTRWGRFQPVNKKKDKLVLSGSGNDDDFYHYYTEDGLKRVFNKAGKLKTVFDRSGRSHSLVYNVNGKLESVTASDGRAITLSYNSDLLLSTLTDPAGNTVSYDYDAVGNLVHVSFPDEDEVPENNPAVVYHYEDPRHLFALTGKSDARGNRIATWTYDDEGRVVTSSHIDGNDFTQFAYTDSSSTVTKNNGYQKTLTYQDGRLASVSGDMCASDGTKGTTTFAYNTYGQLIQKSLPDGSNVKITPASNGEISLIYDAYVNNYNYLHKTSYNWHPDYNLPTIVKDSNLRSTYFDYGVNGRLEKKRVYAGGVNRITLYHYNSQGWLQSIDGPRTDVNDITTYSYYVNGDLHTITNALGHVTTFNSYDSHGRATSISDPNGVITLLEYDPRGQLKQLQSANQTYTFGYDKQGNLITSNDGNQTLTYGYDNDNRLTSITDANGNSQNFTLDNYGNIVNINIKNSALDVLYTANQTFDLLNRVTSSSDSLNQTTQFGYDVMGNKTGATNPLQHSTSSVMDSVARLTKVIDAKAGEVSLTYDHLDNVTSVTDQNGNVTNYTYTGFGDLTKIVSVDSGTTRFTHDLAGNVLTKTDARGIKETSVYDALNRVVSRTYLSQTDNILFTYDETGTDRHGIGRLTSVSTSDYNIAYAYTAGGLLKSETKSVTQNGQSYQHITGYEYANGLLTKLIYPSGTEIEYGYDLGRVSSVALNSYDSAGAMSTTALASNVSYLPFGPISSLSYGNGKVMSQSYNDSYVLTNKSVSGVFDKNYTLNAINNITTVATQGEATPSVYGYDELSRLTTATGDFGDLAYEYDGIGNRTKKTTAGISDAYQYATNKLVSAAGKSFTYDANGNATQMGADIFEYNSRNRLSKAILSAGTYEYGYDFSGRRIKKSNGSAHRFYHYDQNGLLLAEENAGGTNVVEYIYLNGKRLALNSDGQLYYLHTNHLDAPIAMSDSSSNLVWKASYSPFGITTIIQNDIPLNLSAKFPGQYSNEEMGLFYNYFRDYDPEIGRYIQSDPIGLDDGVNTYAYVGSNPINNFDSDGLSKRSVRHTTSNQALANFNVRRLIREIQRHDTTFRYQTMRPLGANGRYTRQDIASLQQSLSIAQNAGFCGPGASNPVAFPQAQSQIMHIFRAKTGHVNPSFSSSQNRFINLFRSVGSNSANRNDVGVRVTSHAVNFGGVRGYTQQYNNGTVWVTVGRNGVIQNAGVNR